MTKMMMDFLNELTGDILETLTTPEAYLNKMTLSLVVLLIGYFVGRIVKGVLQKKITDLKKRHKIKRVFNSIISFVIIFCVLFIWIEATNALVLIMLAFVLFAVVLVRGLINNIIGWFLINKQRYFKLYDRIELKGIIGDVSDVSLFHFELREIRQWLTTDSPTGRTVRFPNSIIFDTEITNYTQLGQYVWHEIAYTLTFDSNWEEARKIILEEGQRYQRDMLSNPEHQIHLQTEKDLVIEKVEPVFTLDFTEQGLVLSMRYLVHYQEGGAVKTLLHGNIIPRLKKHPEIEFVTLDVRLFQESSSS